MDFSVGYIFSRLSFRILEFFRNWYWGGLIRFSEVFYALLRKLDREFAVAITAKNWFKPLYGDFTVLGYALGFIFRTLRVLFGSIFYIFIAIIFLTLFLAWAILPILVIYKIIFYAGKF